MLIEFLVEKQVGLMKDSDVQKIRSPKRSLCRAYKRLDMIKSWRTHPGIQGDTDLLALVAR